MLSVTVSESAGHLQSFIAAIALYRNLIISSSLVQTSPCFPNIVKVRKCSVEKDLGTEVHSRARRGRVVARNHVDKGRNQVLAPLAASDLTVYPSGPAISSTTTQQSTRTLTTPFNRCKHVKRDQINFPRRPTQRLTAPCRSSLKRRRSPLPAALLPTRLLAKARGKMTCCTKLARR